MLKTIVSALWRYSVGYRAWLFALIACAMGRNIVLLASPYAIGQSVNALQTGTGVNVSLQWLFVYGVAETVGVFLNALNATFEMKLGHESQQNFRRICYRKLLALPLAWHTDHHTGNTLSRVNRAATALTGFMLAPGLLLGVFIQFFGTTFVLLHVYSSLGFIAMGVGAFTIVFSYLLNKKIVFYTKLANEAQHKVAAALTDYISNIRTLIILRLGLQTENDLLKRTRQTSQAYYKEISWRQKRWVSIDFLVDALQIAGIVFVILSFQNDSHSMRIGDLIMVIQYLRQMSGAIYGASRFYQNLSQDVSNFDDIDQIEQAYLLFGHGKEEAIHTHNQWQQMQIQDLSFAYGPYDADLKQLNFSLQRGQKIALVGKSGSGKSTLMSVLRGLYAPDTGVVQIDGKLISFDDLSSLTTLIPQEPEIFENTIVYNITIGIEHSEAEILEACRLACFDDVLAELPQGLASDIREKGVNLSGGQKQRLALARGIFAIQQSSLVLFDEPTSSVDAVTERRIYQNLLGAFPDICLISSIHRLYLLSLFDHIIVMEQGKIVQQGTLEQLKNAPGAFQTLWQAYEQDGRIP